MTRASSTTSSATEAPDDPDLAAAAAIRSADEKAYDETRRASDADHTPVTFVAPDGVERTVDSPGEKVALAFAGWTEKKASAGKKDA